MTSQPLYRVMLIKADSQGKFRAHHAKPVTKFGLVSLNRAKQLCTGFKPTLGVLVFPKQVL
jgi:hypothetical protein